MYGAIKGGGGDVLSTKGTKDTKRGGWSEGSGCVSAEDSRFLGCARNDG